MNPGYEWHDLVGNLGVLLIVGSYFWLQLGRISGQSLAYSLVFWLAISLMGAVRVWVKPVTG